MATGDQSGTWGDTTNTNLGTLLEQAITGVLSVAQGDVANFTPTNLDGASDQARNAVINLTGAMTAARNMVVPTANKLYLVKNSTTGGFQVTVKTAAGTGVAIQAGAAMWVYCDGTNVVQGLAQAEFTGATPVLWSYTDAGAAVGPLAELRRISSSPAANDILGRLTYSGYDSAGNIQEYASIESLIVSPTSTTEVGALDIYTTIAGTRTRTMSIGPNNPNTPTAFIDGYATTASAAGTTTLTVASACQEFFTGTTTQTVVLPVTSTLVLGQTFKINNNSTGAVTVQSSGANNILVLAPGMVALFTCILTSGTSAASWDGKLMRGGLELLAAGTVSSAATLDFVLTSYTSYRGFVIKLFNLLPASDGQGLLCRVSTNGGSSYDAGASDYGYQINFTDSGTNFPAGSAGASSILLTSNQGNTAGSETVGLSIELQDPFNTGAWTKLLWHLGYLNASGNSNLATGAGWRRTSQDTDAIRFLYQSGNIASGSYAVYGYV